MIEMLWLIKIRFENNLILRTLEVYLFEEDFKLQLLTANEEAILRNS